CGGCACRDFRFGSCGLGHSTTRTENPRVGGSIPPLGTMNSSESVENFCSPDRFNIATVLRRPEYFDTPWNGFAADKKHSIPEADRKAYTKAYARSGRCATAGSTSPFSPDGDGIRRVRQDEADLPGAVDR